MFVVPAHAVGLAGHALLHDAFQGGAVVLHIEPVADVLTVAVDGDGFALGHARDGQGDQLLGVLAGTVVVGAVGGDRVQPIGVVVGPDQVVAAGLAGAVRAVGGVGHGLVELARLPQGAVHLVRADVQEPAVLLAGPGLARRLQHGEGAHDVRLDEGGGAGDAPVHVALRRQVEHLPDAMPLDQVAGQLQVLDVPDHQLHALEALDLLRIGRVGQPVQHHDAVAGMGAVPAVHQVAADESGAAGDEDGFRHGGSPTKEEERLNTDGHRSKLMSTD